MNLVAYALAAICGAGPVTLSMTIPLDCAMDAGCTIESIGREDAYRVVCACQAPGYGIWGAHFESWSDWPECQGQRLTSDTGRTILVTESPCEVPRTGRAVSALVVP